jgi:hypothetical protein
MNVINYRYAITTMCGVTVLRHFTSLRSCLRYNDLQNLVPDRPQHFNVTNIEIRERSTANTTCSRMRMHYSSTFTSQLCVQW